MRFDSIGMFWQDMPTSRKRSERELIRPPVPETGWKAPTEFPNLSSAVILSIDVETYDPELDQSGPGWARGVGEIVGFSVGAQDAAGNIGQWYFPIRHRDTPEDNLDPETCLRWLQEQVSDNRPKVGARLIYDVGWLAQEGVIVRGPLYDIQYAEALLHSESRSVSLDHLAAKYLGEHKQATLLYQWIADYYGIQANDRCRKYIYNSPPSLVGPYGESDASLPLRIMAAQWPLLAQEGLLDLFDMECRLIPLLVAMRFAGVAVDLARAEQYYDTLGAEVAAIQQNLDRDVGFPISVNSPDDLARAFDAHGIPYGRTAPSERNPEGQPSFTAGFLEACKHRIAQQVVDIRQREKIRGTFIKSYILDNHVNGMVYGSFNQLQSDSAGARSGRFSSDTPNLQNIPIRTAIGKEIRRIFVPDPGHPYWRKYDYSQIEYRFLAHYAVGDGADNVRQQYNDDPDTDYHQLVHDLILSLTGIDLIRGHTKNMNFGLIYGLGEPSLADQLGLALSKAKELFSAYHKGAPFARATMQATMKEAQAYGVITTILGRKTRFDLWEPADWGVQGIPLPYGAAVSKYGRVKRAKTHKALNRRLQGSAADLMKKAMLLCYEGGIFAETGVPRLTVHDELDFSDPGGRDAAFNEMKHVMETAIPLRIPVRADYEIGANWGDAKEPV